MTTLPGCPGSGTRSQPSPQNRRRLPHLPHRPCSGQARLVADDTLLLNYYGLTTRVEPGRNLNSNAVHAFRTATCWRSSRTSRVISARFWKKTRAAATKERTTDL